jgi:hypothetical protein
MATRTQRGPDQFVTIGAVVTLLGCVLAAVTPFAAGSSAAFTGSLVTSGLLGAVFAGRNLQTIRSGRVAAAPALLSTIFGGWFMIAPLLYDVGFVATAGTQFAGLLVASFGMYATVAAVGSWAGRLELG